MARQEPWWRRWQEKAEVAWDLRRTRRESRRLLDTVTIRPNGRTAIIGNVADLPYNVKREAILADALRLAGWDVVIFLPPKSVKLAEKYFRAMGFERFLRWDDIVLTSEAGAIVEEEMRSFDQVERSVRAMKNWFCRGCLLGPQILASVSRKFYEGRLRFGEEKSYAEIRKVARIGVEYVLKAEKIFESLSCDMLVLSEPNYTAFAPLVDLAIQRKIQVISVFQPYREDGLLCWKLRPQTRRGHPSSVSLETWQKLKEVPWSETLETRWAKIMADRYNGTWVLQDRNQWNVSIQDIDQVRSGLGLDPAKKTVVIFTGVLWDANLFYGEDLFEDNGEWFIETIRAACLNPQVNWVIKLHPANRWKLEFEGIQGELGELKMIREHMGELPPHVKLLKPDAPYSNVALYRLTDVAVTVRGSVGVELPCYGIPVLTGGTGRYAGLGFTLDSKSPAEYLERLSRVQDLPRLTAEQATAAKKHALATFEARWWLMETYRAKVRNRRYPKDLFDRNIFVQTSHLIPGQMPEDFQGWQKWAEDPNSATDYFRWEVFSAGALT
jgi:hypothetical protein